LGVDLPDCDVFEIDTQTLAVRRRYQAVGTTLFGMTQRPGTAELWIGNTNARNLIRFEPNLRGHVVDNRVTRIVTGGSPTVQPIDLNPGVDYSKLPNDAALSTALAQPTDVVFDRAGKKAYVAAFGTDRIGVLDATGNVLRRIEVGNTPGTKVDPRHKRGPRALALYPKLDRLYVYNRLANSISVIDTANDTVLTETPLIHDPTPATVKEARGFLYDAKLSGNGTMACASCHVGGRIDGLAWDLGDPGGDMTTARGRGNIGTFQVHPMKGPMTTQTLQGLRGVEPFHWRGERARLQDFNSAFRSLMGKTELSTSDMDDYATFLQSIEFPPNPNQNLDRSLPDSPRGLSARDGFNVYTTFAFAPPIRCVDCHSLDAGTNGLIIPANTLNEPQPFKVPQLRNVYKLTGRKKRAQGRTSGFGLLHDGSVDDVFGLLTNPVFRVIANDSTRKTMLMRFVEAFDTGTAPSVGYSVTVSPATITSTEVQQAVLLLINEANRGNCDLVAHGELDGRRIGLEFDVATKRWRSDRTGVGPFQLSELDARVRQNKAHLTLVGVPLGSAHRIGNDRDLDGTADGDEGLDAYGTSTPGCNGALELTGNSTPDLGNDQFALVCTNAAPSTNGFLLVSAAPSSLQLFGITLLTDLRVGFVLPMTVDAAGLGTTPMPLPSAPAFKGAVLYSQAVSASTCAKAGLCASQGLKTTLDK